jgi:hypothetical protein
MQPNSKENGSFCNKNFCLPLLFDPVASIYPQENFVVKHFE